jgi:hypothetical protein
MTLTVSRFLFTAAVGLALVCVPNPAFAKHHGGGSRGGGGSHGGSHSHGGGGGGFHGGGHSHSSGGGGFHFGGGGHSSGKSFRSGHSAAPRQTGGGSSGRIGGLPARATSNSAFFGGRTASSNSSRNINATSERTIGSSFFRASAAGTRAPVMNPAMNFGSNRPPTAASPARSWSGQSQSSWANASRSPSSFNANRPPSAASPARSWSGQGQSSWANASRSPSSFNANRPPTAPSPTRSWPGQGQSSWASTPRSPSSFNPNRPPNATSSSRSRSGQNQSSWASLSRSTVSYHPNRGLSNSGNSRFGNSAFSHSSRSHSRNGSRSAGFGGSRFGGANHSDWGGNSFNQAASFGGPDFSFIPDLFGLALNLGGFGLRGLTLLGPGLNLGVTGLELLASGLDNFNPDPSLESRQWGPGPILDPNGNCNCTQ